MQIWLFFVCLLEIDMDMYTTQLLYLAIVSEQSVALGTIFFTLCGHTLQEGGKSAFLTLKIRVESILWILFTVVTIAKDNCVSA